MGDKEFKLNELPPDAKGEVVTQLVMVEDGITSFVPNDPLNRHYVEAKEWHEAQKTKPFKFKFEEPTDS